MSEDDATLDGHTLTMPFWRWAGIVRQLRDRGRGERESGAFLLGQLHDGRGRIQRAVYYDQIDPHALDHGYVWIRTGFEVLYEICRRERMRIIADVHTHPGASTHQSDLDMRNPMSLRRGHLALIMPHFAQAPWWELDGIGLYEYLGDYQWRTWTDARTERFRLSLL